MPFCRNGQRPFGDTKSKHSIAVKRIQPKLTRLPRFLLNLLSLPVTSHLSKDNLHNKKELLALIAEGDERTYGLIVDHYGI